MGELRAVVDEAGAVNRYVCAYAYTARAVNRALEAGIRSIEHGKEPHRHLQRVAARRAGRVPGADPGDVLGAAEGRQAVRAAGGKLDEVLDTGLSALDLAYRGGVRLAYGTDLLGGMHRHQSEEFRIRAHVQLHIDIIRAATCVAAELLRAEGQLGTHAAGAHADVIVLGGDRLEDIGLLADPAAHMPLVIQASVVVRQR
jgi:imidazolonepropionase-like amidohydrolase